MESNAMTWNEVAASIIEDDRGKWDRKLPAASLSIGQNGQLVTMNGGPAPEPYVLSELATGQLCERLGIPATYYRRLPPEMKATVANFDLKRMSERPFLLRGKGTHVRAVLSGEYVAYNNNAIVETVESLLRSEGLRIRSFVLEETICFLKIVSEELVESASGLKAGIMIGNSEVGMGSVSVEPFVFRKACTNASVDRSKPASRRHLKTGQSRRQGCRRFTEVKPLDASRRGTSAASSSGRR